MQNARYKFYPRTPNSAQDFHEILNSPKGGQFCKIQEEPFYYGQVASSLLFVVPGTMRALAKATHISLHLDGTYKTKPAIFGQLFMAYAEIDSKVCCTSTFIYRICIFSVDICTAGPAGLRPRWILYSTLHLTRIIFYFVFIGFSIGFHTNGKWKPWCIDLHLDFGKNSGYSTTCCGRYNSDRFWKGSDKRLQKSLPEGNSSGLFVSLQAGNYAISLNTTYNT